MIPTRTLRQRLESALEGELIAGMRPTPSLTRRLTNAALAVIGDPVLVKTADTLEPTFTLRAQDTTSDFVVRVWVEMARAEGAPEAKLREAEAIAKAMQEWPTRKSPD